MVEYKDGKLHIRTLCPNSTISTMGCARGDETVTIRVDGVVYRNIKISEAYNMIAELNARADMEDN